MMADDSRLARGAQVVRARYLHGSVQEDERIRHARAGGVLMVLGAASGMGLLPVLPPRVDDWLVYLLAGGCLSLGLVIPWLPWDRWPRWTLLTPAAATVVVVFGGGGMVDDALDFYALFLPLVFIYLGLAFPLAYAGWTFAICMLGLVLAVATGHPTEAVPYVLLGTLLSVVAGVVLALQRRTEVQSHEAMRVLAEAATQLGAATDRQQVADVVAAASAELFGADDVEVLLLSQGPEPSAVRALHGRSPLSEGDGAVLARAQDLVGSLATVPGASHATRRGPAAGGAPFRLVVAVPGPDGPRGAIVVEQRRRAQASDRFAARSLDVLSREAGQVLDRIRRTDELETSSRTDALTGLGNRAVLQAALDGSAAGDVFILLDLDHFKRVNDTLGHARGDQVLVAFAGVLRGAARVNQVVARYGGEEFATILPQAEGRAVERHLQDVRRAWAALDMRVTFSSGTAVREAGETAEAALARADAALYLAKHGGRDQDVRHPGSVGGDPPAPVATPPLAHPASVPVPVPGASG